MAVLQKHAVINCKIFTTRTLYASGAGHELKLKMRLILGLKFFTNFKSTSFNGPYTSPTKNICTLFLKICKKKNPIFNFRFKTFKKL